MNLSMKDAFSAKEGGKFILGAFLAVGFFSATIDYGSQVYFLIQEGNPPVQHVIDLTKNEKEIIPKGHVKITGYPSEHIPYEWVDMAGETLDSLTYYYYALLGTPNKNPENLVVVVNKEFESNYSNYHVQQPNIETKKTISGISGYYAHGEKKIINYFKEKYTIKDPEKIFFIAEGEPPTKNIFKYFIPAAIAFSFGIFLVMRWVFLVRKEYRI